MYLVYAQRNVPGGQQVPWAGQRLGTCNNITIGSDGCLTCAQAQVLTHYEHPINPAQLDDLYTNRGWYASGCQGVDTNPCRVDARIVRVETRDFPNRVPMSYFAMGDDEEIIVGLDTHNLGRKAEHFARVFDYDPRTGILRIDDPWWGVTENFASRWGDPAKNVVKVMRYRIPGWVPPWKRHAVPTPVPGPLPPAPVVIAPIVVDPAQLAVVKDQLAAAGKALLDATALYNADEAAITAVIDILNKRKGV